MAGKSAEPNGAKEAGMQIVEDDYIDEIGDDCGMCEDGWMIDDCFEDTCCCANHDLVPCPQCNPGGFK